MLLIISSLPCLIIMPKKPLITSRKLLASIINTTQPPSLLPCGNPGRSAVLLRMKAMSSFTRTRLFSSNSLPYIIFILYVLAVHFYLHILSYTKFVHFLFKWWMSEYSNVQPFGLNKQVFVIRNESILPNNEPTGHEYHTFKQLKNTLGVKVMQAVNVIHCRFAYGLSIEHNSGWKLVYSGDTRPCDNLIQVGQNATLLVHELLWKIV